MMDHVERCDTDDGMAPKEKMIGIRVTDDEHHAWHEAARKDGRTLSSWIIARCRGIPATAPEIPDDKPKKKPR